MIRVLRATGSVALWLAAVVGILCGLVWGATKAGIVRPLVVISGSMEPGIMTGDLILDRPQATASARVGQVASIRSTVTGKVVSHRIVDIEPVGDGRWDVTLKGDANDVADAETYEVGDRLWQPVLRVPGAGRAVSAAAKPSFTVPLGIALLSCIMLALLPADETEGENGGRAATVTGDPGEPAEASPMAAGTAVPVSLPEDVRAGAP